MLLGALALFALLTALSGSPLTSQAIGWEAGPASESPLPPLPPLPNPPPLSLPQVTFQPTGGGEPVVVGPVCSQQQADLVCDVLTGEGAQQKHWDGAALWAGLALHCDSSRPLHWLNLPCAAKAALDEGRLPARYSLRCKEGMLEWMSVFG